MKKILTPPYFILISVVTALITWGAVPLAEKMWPDKMVVPDPPNELGIVYLSVHLIGTIGMACSFALIAILNYSIRSPLFTHMLLVITAFFIVSAAMMFFVIVIHLSEKISHHPFSTPGMGIPIIIVSVATGMQGASNVKKFIIRHEEEIDVLKGQMKSFLSSK